MATALDQFIQRIRAPAYFVLIAATAIPITEVFVAIWPWRLGIASWRFGAVGTVVGSLTPALVGLLLVTCVALLANDRVVLWIIVAVGAIAAVFAVLAMGIFVLDAIQTRDQIRPEVIRRFDFASVVALVKLTAVACGTGLLAWTAFRSARRRDRADVKDSRPAVFVGRAVDPVPNRDATKS